MTPTTRCPATSPRRSRCSTPTTMASCCPRSSTATPARLYCKQVHGGRGEHQLSPEEEEAVRLALAGEVGLRDPGDALGAGRVSGAARDGQRRGVDGGRAGAEGVPLATLRDVVLSVQDGRDRARAGAGRERARGRRGPGARRARARGARRVARRRGRPAGVATASPPAASWRSTEITMVLSHPQALGQCTALARRAPAERGAGVPAASTADAVRSVAGERDGHARGDRPAARGPALRRGDARRGPRGRSRQRDAVRLARPRPRTRRAAPDERAGEDDAACSGAPAPARRAGSSRAWPCSRSRA